MSHQWWSNLIWFMNEKLFNVKLSYIPPYNIRYCRVYAPASTLYSLAKNDMRGLWLIARCKLAPTLARLTWRHNDVIRRNEYLISTLSESTFPWVYSLQFLFKSTHNSWRYERKREWVFFFLNTVYIGVWVYFGNSVFLSCRPDRQNRQQPIQGILLKVSILPFKESQCKLCSFW